MPVEAISRPFSRVPLKLGDRPRTEMSDALPELRPRWAETPGRREIDSATLWSGSLPMSSAEIASTMELEFFLIEMAASMPRRMPVTVTVFGINCCTAAGATGGLVLTGRTAVSLLASCASACTVASWA